MKLLAVALLFVFVGLNSQAQNDTLLYKKWKIVSMKMDGLFGVDAKIGEVEYYVDLDSLVANDKEPDMSKAILTAFIEGMAGKMKKTVVEFKPDGTYLEIDPIRQRERKGTYTLIKGNLAIKAQGEEEPQPHTYQLTKTSLTLLGALKSTNGKTSKTTWVYEPL